MGDATRILAYTHQPSVAAANRIALRGAGLEGNGLSCRLRWSIRTERKTWSPDIAFLLAPSPISAWAAWMGQLQTEPACNLQSTTFSPSYL